MSHISMVNVDSLIPYVNNARKHSYEQISQIAASIKEFGWTNPILVDGENGIIAGHGRLQAALKLGIEQVPVIELKHLSEAQKKALIIADNKIASNADWDKELLSLELDELKELDFDIELLGFSFDELIAGSYDGNDLEQEEQPKEVNYAIQYNLVFESEGQQSTWFGFIKNLKMMFPDEETLGARLRKFIEENKLG
jgi:ParB-like chromosome segregation protein Spo0J